MISLTRLSGTTFLLNADLVERVDCTPDTVVTLVDGTKYLVSETLDEVLAEVIDYRAAIVARAALPDAASVPAVRTTPRPARLAAVPHPAETRPAGSAGAAGPAGPAGTGRSTDPTAPTSTDRHRGGMS
ncbi:MAG TPA: flagellar FlbD family protein [Nocardioides sp.]|nr:flagellar FlbD family protein [Nocardioides sp.]